MATQTVRALTVTFSPAYAWECFEAEEQGYKRGAILCYSASGMVYEPRSIDPTALAGIALRAGQDKSGSGSVAKTQFMPLLPGCIVEGNLVSGAAGSLTVRATCIGTQVGLIKRTAETDTPWAFDANETEYTQFRIIGIKDASGDVNARVYAAPMASYCAWTGGQSVKTD